MTLVDIKQRWFFALCASEGMLALAFLFLIPSEGGSLSPARLALITFLCVLTSGWIFCWLRPLYGMKFLARPRLIQEVALLSLDMGLLLFLLRYLNPEKLLPYYERLSPLLWYVFILFVQTLLFSLVLRHGFYPKALAKDKSLYIAFGVVFCILLTVLLFVSLTGLGITKDVVYWGEPGVAIPFWLLGLALLLGAGFLVYEWRFFNPSQQSLTNFLIPCLIWLAATALWLSVPITQLKNSFYAPITPPYATPFPYSDAGFYDYMAQSLLVGADYLGGIPSRPLYVTFLAFLHFLLGQNYVNLITVQVVVLALFPVILYWLGSRLHSHSAGLTIAALAIFRELTSLWLTSDVRTSVSKMFLTDFPTALGVAMVCLVSLRWLERRDEKSALFTGGMFGLLLLLRTQSAVILPILLLLSWLVYRKERRAWFLAWLILAGMLLLTIAPWMLRNYLTTGRFTLDYTSPTSVIYSQLSGESVTSGFGTDEGARNQLAALLMKNFGVVSGYVANHFLNTQIGGLLTLPLIARFDGLLAPVNPYWVEWDGSLAWYNLILVIYYLAVIALGIGAAWRRLRWLGLLPLAFSAGYALSNGIARYSSWRYNLPADWVAYFYFGIGSIEVFTLVVQLFGGNPAHIVRMDTGNMKNEQLQPSALISALVFVFIGALPWLVEGMVAPRYADQSLARITQLAGTASNAPTGADIQEFAARPGVFWGAGRLLYPRFFPRDKGLASANPWPPYAVRNFPRFGFLLLNQELTFVVFPARSGLTIPHAADAIILGCLHGDYVEAREIVLPSLDIVYTSGTLSDPCSP